MGTGHSHEPHVDLNSSIDISKLSDEEKTRLAHEQLHAKHRGHESMHAWMILILITAVVVAQVILVEWKKRYPKTYQRVSLVAMWLIPFFVCVRHHWWRFIFFWILFTVLTCIIMSRAIQKPIAGTTPRIFCMLDGWFYLYPGDNKCLPNILMVYMWFYAVYMLSYALGVVGYVVIMLLLFGVNLLFRSSPQPWMDLGILCLFYGLYYGVLGRDIAEIVTDRMATTIGYYTSTGVPVKQLTPGVCAVCGNKILVQENSDAVVEKSYKLSCDHVFHEFCIRGWCIVGKKQTCPYCKEKVDLKRMFCNPWERPHVFYGNFLDFIRYLVAWQPLILTGVQFINYSLGLE